VALLSFFTGLGTAASVAQQIHTIVLWRDVKLVQFQHQVGDAGNPELAVAGPSTGADLVLFYIRTSKFEPDTGGDLAEAYKSTTATTWNRSWS